MKFKLIIDDSITIEKEINGNFKSFNLTTDTDSYKLGEDLKEDDDLFDDSFFRF